MCQVHSDPNVQYVQSRFMCIMRWTSKHMCTAIMLAALEYCRGLCSCNVLQKTWLHHKWAAHVVHKDLMVMVSQQGFLSESPAPHLRGTAVSSRDLHFPPKFRSSQCTLASLARSIFITIVHSHWLQLPDLTDMCNVSTVLHQQISLMCMQCPEYPEHMLHKFEVAYDAVMLWHHHHFQSRKLFLKCWFVECHVCLPKSSPAGLAIYGGLQFLGIVLSSRSCQGIF